jgi:hypothetical protein
VGDVCVGDALPGCCPYDFALGLHEHPQAKELAVWASGRRPASALPCGLGRPSLVSRVLTMPLCHAPSDGSPARGPWGGTGQPVAWEALIEGGRWGSGWASESVAASGLHPSTRRVSVPS